MGCSSVHIYITVISRSYIILYPTIYNIRFAAPTLTRPALRSTEKEIFDGYAHIGRCFISPTVSKYNMSIGVAIVGSGTQSINTHLVLTGRISLTRPRHICQRRTPGIFVSPSRAQSPSQSIAPSSSQIPRPTSQPSSPLRASLSQPSTAAASSPPPISPRFSPKKSIYTAMTLKTKEGALRTC